jgi:hypothetical protein
MYQLDDTGVRRLQAGHEPPKRSEIIPRRNEKGRSEMRLRVVRVPGGFAFVEDRPDPRRS